MTTLPADVTFGELGQLTLPALTAFAARVAARALLLLGDIEPDHQAALVAGVEAAAGFAAGTPVEDLRLVDRAYTAAEALSATHGFAGYAAAHASRVARFAGRNDDGAFNETVASTFGAVRAVLNTCRPSDEAGLRAAHRADLEALLRLRLPADGMVDVSAAGPLGPLGEFGSAG